MKLKNLLMCSVMLCLTVAFSACTKEETIISMFSNGADLVVNNLTTGESGKNLGAQLVVQNGDVLEVIYTPESEYQKYSWTVTFDLFDKESKTVEKSPYTFQYTVDNMIPGDYYIECSAKIVNEKDVVFDGADFGQIKIKVTE